VRLELLTKAQRLELLNQLRATCISFADQTNIYRELDTVHALTVNTTTVYLGVEWIYFNHDVFVTDLKFISKDAYQTSRGDN
jgi:hypothetical protein